MWNTFAMLIVTWLLPHLLSANKKYTFEVSMQYKSPDCVERPITLINGKFPGPTINITAGELIEVEVRFFILTLQCVFLNHNCVFKLMKVQLLYYWGGFCLP